MAFFPTQPHIIVGGAYLPLINSDLKPLITLTIICSNGKYSTFRTYAGTPYTPSSSNNFRARAVRVIFGVAVSTTTTNNLVYGTNDVGVDSAVAPTAVVKAGNTDAGTVPTNGTPTFIAETDLGSGFLMPNGNLMAILRNDATAGVNGYQVFGYEEAP